MVVSVDALGEDLVLLSIDPERGRIRTAQRIDYGLMGSELVRLAAARRIDIVRDWITVLDAAPTGDAELDAALQSLASARRPPRARTWVAHRRRGIGAAYLARLAAAGTLSAEPGRTFIVRRTRWRVNDAGRLAEARARLDAAAFSAGPAVQAAVHAAVTAAVSAPVNAATQAAAASAGG
jgi:Golgi phosphoprotein 3 (GPP34)